MQQDCSTEKSSLAGSNDLFAMMKMQQERAVAKTTSEWQAAMTYLSRGICSKSEILQNRLLAGSFESLALETQATSQIARSNR